MVEFSFKNKGKQMMFESLRNSNWNSFNFNATSMQRSVPAGTLNFVEFQLKTFEFQLENSFVPAVHLNAAASTMTRIGSGDPRKSRNH